MKNKTMKLKKNLNRKDKNTGKEFFRYDITIDPKLIEELEWLKGDTLNGKVSDNKLIIEKD
jgi:hypothetical protein